MASTIDGPAGRAFCPQCGAAVADGGRFCGECGTAIEAPPSAPLAPAAPTPAEPAVRTVHRTMIGGAAAPVPASPAVRPVVATPAEPVDPVRVATAHQTMIGAAVALAPRPPEPTPTASPKPAGEAVPVANAEPTMMGVSPNDARRAVGVPRERRDAVPMSVGAYSVDGRDSPAPWKSKSAARLGDSFEDAIPGLKRTRNRRALAAVGAFVLVAAFAVTVAVLVRRTGSNGTGPGPTHVVVPTFEAQFDPGATVANPATLRVDLTVSTGAQLWIDGRAVAVDSRGHASVSLGDAPVLPLDGPDSIERTLTVRVAVAGAQPVERSVALRVPRAALTVERPPLQTATASDRVVVRGRAPGASVVEVNGHAATRVGDVYEAVISLPSLGRETIEVVSRARGAAPARGRIEVQRTAANLRAVITGLGAGAFASASELARGALTVGQHVRVRGRVLGESRPYQGGETFQLVVQDAACADGRCVLWVDTEPQGAPAAGRIVEVIGTVSGRRQWTAASGERRSDFVAIAAFIVER